MKKLRKNESGQSLVEFALCVPILFIVLMGIIDMGWMFFNQLNVQEACRSAARFVCVNSTGTETQANYDALKSQVKSMVDGSLVGVKPGDTTVDITYSDTLHPLDGYVTVTVKTKMFFLTPVIGSFIGNEKDLIDDTTMKVES